MFHRTIVLSIIFLTLGISNGNKAFSQNWDINTVSKLNSTRSAFLKDFSKVVSSTSYIVCAGVPTAMAIYGLTKKDENLLKDAIYIGTSVAEAFVVSYGMKSIFDRERPFDAYPGKLNPAERSSSSSFPSGHTATAFSLATSMSIRYPRWYVIAPSAIWACSVGYSRMQRGVHYPTDVISGAVIGTGCAFANVYLNRWLNRVLFDKKR